MYVGVPMEVPATVSIVLGADASPVVRAALMALAMPKSVTVALPVESSTLSGLMSRCTMPLACA